MSKISFTQQIKPSLNRSHPLTKNLQLFWPLTDAFMRRNSLDGGDRSRFIELVRGSVTTEAKEQSALGINDQKDVGPFGYAYKSLAAGSGLRVEQTYSFPGPTIPGTTTEDPIRPGSCMTIGGWIKVTSFPVSPGYGTLISNRRAGTNIGWYIAYINATGKIDAGLQLDGGPTYRAYSGTGNYSLSLNVWHHVMLTYTGRVLTGYIDGKLDSQTDFGSYVLFSGRIVDYAGGNDIIRIGNDLFGDVVRGSIAMVGVWDRALTHSEVSMLYHQPGCIFHTPMNKQKLFDNINTSEVNSSMFLTF